MVGRKAWTIVDNVACQTVVDSVQAMVEHGRPWASMSVGVDNGKPWSVGVENRKTNVEVKSPMVERGRPRSAAIDHGRPLSATGDHGRPWSPEALSTKVSLVGVGGHADYRRWSTTSGPFLRPHLLRVDHDQLWSLSAAVGLSK